MGIYDAMKMCKADVSTICMGLAASMGAFLLASGSKGKRYCMPNARVMIHQPLGTSGGKVCAYTSLYSSTCSVFFLLDTLIREKPKLCKGVIDGSTLMYCYLFVLTELLL